MPMSALMDAYGVDLEDLSRLTPARMGSLLREARSARSMSLETLARRAAVGRWQLRLWEKGRSCPVADEIVRLAGALEMRVDELVPPRSPVRYHPGAGTITVGQQTVAVIECATDGDGNDAVLRTYVEAVSRSRGCPPASSFALRRDDVAALVQLLDLRDSELDTRLQRLLGLSAPDAAVLHSRLISRRVAFAAAASISAIAALPLAGSAS